MALTPMQTALCNSIEQQWAGIIGPITAARAAYLRELRQLESDLLNAIYTPQNLIDAKLDELQGEARDNMPRDDLAAMDELKTILENCDFLGAFSPATAVLSGTAAVFDKINNLVDDAALTIPDFGLGKQIVGLVNKLEGAGIPGGSTLKELFQKAEQLINCLDTVCGYAGTGKVTEKINELNALVTDYKLNDDYELDLDSIYTDAGMSASEKTGMSTIVDGVTGIQSDASSAIDSAVAAVKNLTKGGGFF